MTFADKLQLLRRNKGYTQEELAEALRVSRQAVAKWEAGQGYPDIGNLIAVSELFHVTVDYLVKDGECGVDLRRGEPGGLEELIAFRLEANRNTYAGFSNACPSTRLDSHDYRYEKGGYIYHDTYVGGEQFAGQEAIWKDGTAVYAMNYLGRVLDQRFSGNFLKEALRAASPDHPYRGPRFYQSGEYLYTARVTGDMTWFQGFEEIYCGSDKVYECFFHGGLIR